MRHSFDTRDEWVAARKSWITATDAAAVCGADRYRSRYALWAQKLGLADRPAVGEAAEWGLRLEEPVRRAYAERTGRKVKGFAPYTTFVSKRLEWMAASPDGTIVPRGLYEGKTCGLMAKSDWSAGPPDKYMFQIQHQMEVMNINWCGIACLIGGQQLVHFDVPRDPVFCENLVNEEFAFLGLLMNRTPPAIDGSDSTAAALAQVFSKPTPTRVDLPDHFLSLYRARQDALAIAAAKEDTACEVDNAIKAFMGNNEEAYLPSGERFTWRADKNGTRRFKAP